MRPTELCYLILHQNNRYLLLQENSTYLWTLPGGLNCEDDIGACVALTHQTGLMVEMGVPKLLFQIKLTEPQLCNIDCYLCEKCVGTIRLNKQFVGGAWFTLKEMYNLNMNPCLSGIIAENVYNGIPF